AKCVEIDPPPVRSPALDGIAALPIVSNHKPPPLQTGGAPVCGEECSAQARRERRAYPASGSVRSEQRRLGRKEPPPEGLRRIWPGASLLVGHSPTGGGCSLLAPRPRPNWTQQTSSNLRP